MTKIGKLYWVLSTVPDIVAAQLIRINERKKGRREGHREGKT